MTSLLEEIRAISKETARKLECAGYYSDSDIKSLNREDLRDLLPGEDKFRLRKTVFEIISRPTPQSSIRALLKELKNFIPDEAFSDALTDNGPLLQYLNFLKDLRRGESIGNNIEEFLDAHINLLDRLKMNLVESEGTVKCIMSDLSVVAPPPLKNDTAAPPVESASTFWNPLPFFSLRGSSQSQKEPDHPTNNSTIKVSQNPSSNTVQTQPRTEATVTYRCIVSGNTLGRHLDLLEKLKGPVPGPHPVSLRLREVQHDELSQVIIVFCPVVSRVGTDAESALSGVSSDKPVILVMMHHVHTVRSLPAPGPYPSVVLGVSVFFHETVNGLLQCNENLEAISAIQTKLLEYSTKKSRIAGSYTPSHGYPVTQNSSRRQQPQATVTYKRVIRGITLDRHVDLLQQLKGPGSATVSLDLQETMRYEESQVIIVFCPVVSCVGTDAEAALCGVSSDKPIILVMMHPSCIANSCQPLEPYDNVVLIVNVFFHETVQGLLKCHQNDEAISAIQQKLLEYSTKSEKNTGLF